MWVKINGISSETLSGVQILSLPPITKPRMRTQIATIDGRAGDIVTKLGYEAYNKKITVLLHDIYNLYEVEDFFNTSGTIVFSNEPDKGYTFETIDAIDFERAVKFKKASITFHVQPFKLRYPTETMPLLTASETVYNTGNVNAAPRLRIDGTGTVTITIDGSDAFVVTMPEAGWIVLDAEEMNAYSGDNLLANRNVIGGYEGLILEPGAHTIERSGGTVTSMTIENYSRWI